MIGILEMFAEFDGYQRYEDTLVAWAHRARKRATEVTAMWRLQNPAKFRDLRRRMKRRWKANNPQRWRETKRAANKRYREKHPEKARAGWRRSSAAYRARKKASSS